MVGSPTGTTPPQSGVGGKILVGVLVAVVAGLILVWLVPRFQQPDVRLIDQRMVSNRPGTATVELLFHNDGGKSAFNCAAHWVLDTPGGQRLLTLTSASFGVPAGGDATSASGESRVTIDVPLRDLPAEGTSSNLTIYAECDEGYRSGEWKGPFTR